MQSNTFLFMFFICTFFWASAVQGDKLASYEAYYTLDLIKKRDIADRITDVRGMMLINREKTCEGWTTTEQLRMQIMIKNGESVIQNLQFSGWESDDGKFYRFVTKGYRLGKMVDIRGAGKATNGYGKVTFVNPKRKSIDLPPDTKFPIGFVNSLVNRAKAGEKKIRLPSFDGTDLIGPEWIEVEVLNESKAGVINELKNEKLLLGDGWKMRLRAFAKNWKTPLYSYEAVFLENGIMTKAVLNFDAFKVNQTLKMIRSFEMPQC